MAVDLYLWDGVFTGTALGKENGFEGGVKYLALVGTGLGSQKM